MGKLCKPYGEWVSPISSAVATAKACVLQEVSVSNHESAGKYLEVDVEHVKFNSEQLKC